MAVLPPGDFADRVTVYPPDNSKNITAINIFLIILNLLLTCILILNNFDYVVRRKWIDNFEFGFIDWINVKNQKISLWFTLKLISICSSLTAPRTAATTIATSAFAFNVSINSSDCKIRNRHSCSPRGRPGLYSRFLSRFN